MKSQVKDFVLGNKIPLWMRMVLNVILVSLAFYLQWTGEIAAVGAGFFLMILFLLLNWVKKIDVKKDFHSREREWKPTSREEFLEAYRKIKKISRFVNTSASGFVYVVVAVILGLVFVPLLEEFFRDVPLTIIYLAVDVFIIGFVVFSSGNRYIWNPPDLKPKLEWLLFTEAEINSKWPGRFALEPQFHLEKKQDQYVPVDAKLMVNIKGAPPRGLLGLQYSLSLNSVQSKKYPYFYAVVVARRDFGLEKKYKKMKDSHNAMAAKYSLILKFDRQPGDIDIIVIRQDTRMAKGYYTPKKAIQQLIAVSLSLLEGFK